MKAHTVITGFDNSEASLAALKEAACLTRTGDQVIIVNAVNFNQAEFSVAPELQKQRVDNARKFCNDAIKSLPELKDRRIEIVIKEGEPEIILTETASLTNADMIVLGAYTTGRLRRLLMGSVTALTIQDSPCNVMVVRKQGTKCTGKYESLLVPYDGSAFSQKALRTACDIAKEDQSTITILYAIPPYEEMIEFFRSDPIQNALRDEAQKLIDEALNLASDENLKIKTEIRDGNSAEEIIRLAGELPDCLTIMGTHGWKGFNRAVMGSTTRRVVTHTANPVLVVKE